MATPFDAVIDIALVTVDDYKLGKLMNQSQEGFKTYVDGFLLSAIPNCMKKNTVLQYMAKLARLYYKQQNWEAAIEWFEKSLAHLDENKYEFSQYKLLRNNNLKPLIIAKYSVGNKEEAI